MYHQYIHCIVSVPHHSTYKSVQKSDLYGIPSAGGNPKKLIDRQRFEEGFEELLRVRKPHTIIVYGSANYSCLAAVSTQSRKDPFPTLFLYRFHVHTTKKFAIFTDFSIAKYKILL